MCGRKIWVNKCNGQMKNLMKRIITSLFALVAVVGTALAQVPQPAEPQSEPILLMNATAHLGNGEVIENSAIAFENGKITMVVDATVARIDMSKYKVYQLAGKHVYPGLILPSTNLGLTEVNAVRATRDFSEVGTYTPNVRAQVAYNTDSEIIATLRFNGILLAQATPSGGRITGTSSIMKLDGWNWEDATYKQDDGIHLNWPNRYRRTGWWAEPGPTEVSDNYQEQVDGVVAYLAEAKAYAKGTPKGVNLAFEAMKGLWDGSKILYIAVDEGKSIVDAVNLAKEAGVQRMVIVGGQDALTVAKFLVEEEVPVLLSDVHRLPRTPESDVDMPYKLPYLLTDAGVKVGLLHGSVTNARNLAFYAGTAAGYGLGKEEALKLVTSNTAEILGIGDQVGTIATGQRAMLVVSTGDLLDMRTNNVVQAFIDGAELHLPGKQQALYERFRDKYGIEEE